MDSIIKAMKNLYILTLLLLVFGSCSTSKFADSPLNDKWGLSKLPAFEYDIMSKAEKRPYIDINTSDMSYSGYSGCNNFEGNIEIEANHIHFHMTEITKKFCGDWGLEAKLLDVLGSADRYEVRDSKLKLFVDDSLLCEFKK